MMTWRAVPPIVVALSVLAVALMAAAGGSSTPRTAIVVWFLLTGPGLALTPLLRLNDLWAEWTVVVAISVAIDILVATAFLYAAAWSPSAVFWVLAAVSLAGAAVQLRPGALML
jgi:hypothetical protein